MRVGSGVSCACAVVPCADKLIAYAMNDAWMQADHITDGKITNHVLPQTA